MKSIKARLSLGLLLSLSAVFVLQWWVVSAFVSELALTYISTRLQHDMDHIVANIDFDVHGKIGFQSDSLGPIYHKPFTGHYFRIDSGAQTLRSRSLWDQDLPQPSLSPGETQEQRHPGPQGQNLLLLSQGFEKQGHQLNVVVAEELQSLEAGMARFRHLYALLSLALAVLLILVQLGLVQSALWPLRRLRKQLQQREQGIIDTLSTDTSRELKPLVRELNRLLSALNERLQRSRKAVGNLAHALKTPLSVLRNLGDRDDIKKLPEVHATLQSETQKLQQRIDHELKRARLAGAAATGQTIDLEQEIPPLFAVLRSLYPDKTIELDKQGVANNILPLDREDILELLGNVLDNACKWAQEQAKLTLQSNGELTFIIEDDGPGLHDSDLERIGQRGLRLDEHTHGHGLGLDIARDIIIAYQGSIDFRRSTTLGGLAVIIRLPLPIME